jgi:hypothetical protein
MPRPTLFPRARGRNLSKVAILTALIGIVQSGAAPAETLGQDGPSRPVVVAVPEIFPAVEARSMIVRTPKQDVIVFRGEDMTVEAYVMAMALLEMLRDEDPRPEAGQLIPITGFAVRRPPSERRRKEAESALRSLRGAPLTQIGDLGAGRWIPLPG